MSLIYLPYDPYSLTHRELSRTAPPVLTVAPTNGPAVALDDAKLAARIDGNQEDSLVVDYIEEAADAVELDAEIALLTQTRVQYLDGFPYGQPNNPLYGAFGSSGPIELRRPPIQSVSSITYVDFDGTTQTVDPALYQADLTSRPGLVLPVYGQVWPPCRPGLKAVAVTFVCGYGAPSSIPVIAKHAIYLRVAAAYWNREMGMQETESYDALLDKLRWRKY